MTAAPGKSWLTRPFGNDRAIGKGDYREKRGREIKKQGKERKCGKCVRAEECERRCGKRGGEKAEEEEKKRRVPSEGIGVWRAVATTTEATCVEIQRKEKNRTAGRGGEGSVGGKARGGGG